ncbi:hypothetical protein JYT44_03180, partial [Caldithrix abyssi]|nr:hypothetical protein [Caldithrix abyssi]
ILVEQYGLKPDEKIVVFWTKEISLPHFNRYRLKFRKVFSGKLEKLEGHLNTLKKGGRAFSGEPLLAIFRGF